MVYTVNYTMVAPFDYTLLLDIHNGLSVEEIEERFVRFRNHRGKRQGNVERHHPFDHYTPDQMLVLLKHDPALINILTECVAPKVMLSPLRRHTGFAPNPMVLEDMKGLFPFVVYAETTKNTKDYNMTFRARIVVAIMGRTKPEYYRRNRSYMPLIEWYGL